MKRKPPQQFNITQYVVDKETGEKIEIDKHNPPQFIADRAKAVILTMETGKTWKVVESA